MLDNPKLTARQQQILDLIQTAIARTGAPPTRAEIAAELGFKSANAAEEHLQALARKGVIELVSGTSRGIRLRGDTVRSINAARGSQFSLPIPGLSQLGVYSIFGLSVAALVTRFVLPRIPVPAVNWSHAHHVGAWLAGLLAQAQRVRFAMWVLLLGASLVIGYNVWH